MELVGSSDSGVGVNGSSKTGIGVAAGNVICVGSYIDHSQTAYMGTPGRVVAGAKNDLKNSLDKFDDSSYVIEAMIASDHLPGRPTKLQNVYLVMSLSGILYVQAH